MLHRGGTPRRCTHGVGRDERAAGGADWRASRRAGEMRGQPASRERQERAERGGRRHRQQLQRGVRRESCTHSANGTGSTRRWTADAHLSRAGARTLHPGGPSAACTSIVARLLPRAAPERPLHSVCLVRQRVEVSTNTEHTRVIQPQQTHRKQPVTSWSPRVHFSLLQRPTAAAASAVWSCPPATCTPPLRKAMWRPPLCYGMACAFQADMDRNSRSAPCSAHSAEVQRHRLKLLRIVHISLS
jgi:hypothetical protein